MKGRALILIFLLSFGIWSAGCGGSEEAVEEPAPEADVDMETLPEPGAMVTVSAGEFTMGTDNDPHRLKLAEPAHTVDLPAFEIDVFEVTNGQFARFNLESDYQVEGDWRSYYTVGREDNPVANVTLNDAKAFCEWDGKRLPTEAEWEKAARGEEGLIYPWGEEFDWRKANTNEHGTRDTMEVGSLPEDKSPYGLYDIYGNVQEWTSSELEPYPGAEVVDRNVFNQNLVVIRGASYAMKGESMALFTRQASPPGAQYGYGFRCVRDLDAGEGEATE